MRKVFAGASVFLIIVFYSLLCHAQPDSAAGDTGRNININLNKIISGEEKDSEEADSVLKEIAGIGNLVKFTNPWKVKEGDDSSWAAVNYDDSAWDAVDDTIRDNVDYNSIVWYRMHFKIDSTLYNKPLALFVRQFGSACDIYLDGKYLKSFGKVGTDKENEEAEFSINPKPFAFVFESRQNHVFAVRYSNFHRFGVKASGLNLGKNFNLSVKNLNKEIEDAADPSQYFPVIFFSAIFLTLAVMHFIMFIYNRQRKANLSYSMYCLGIFAITYYIYYILTSTDYESITGVSKLVVFFIPMIVVPLVSMLHRIFYGRRLRIFWVIVGVFALSICFYFLERNKATIITQMVLLMITTVEIIRIILKAIRKGKDGAWIFALVILLAPLTGIISSYLPDEFSIGGMKVENNTGAIVLCSFILGLPFSMTLYLARDFARMSRQLKYQLKEITDLSQKTIAQEKEKKQILENQKANLEEKVAERTREVWQQKEVIEIKNNEITESLIYAKRIQSAILPDIKLIYKTFEQSFILYLPKDIVSGDFYGFAQKNNRIIIAAADCTGHGVAGAFMSMIGSALLNQIINEKNIISPANILDELNEGIIISLKQKESESNEGMDISVCCFDMESNIVEFAGANRPLWLLRNNVLSVYNPDKLPIGGFQIMRKEKFSQHKIQLQKNDAIYLFSDGFSDQFGGEHGKKLMTKKFKDALLGIQHLTMREQENYLHGLFQSWKGKNDQVDDVLVIGIRI